MNKKYKPIALGLLNQLQNQFKPHFMKNNGRANKLWHKLRDKLCKPLSDQLKKQLETQAKEAIKADLQDPYKK